MLPAGNIHLPQFQEKDHMKRQIRPSSLTWTLSGLALAACGEGGSSRPTGTGSLVTFDGEYIRGSYHAESVTGTSRNDIIIDFAGPPDPDNPNNFIHAGEGNDVVYSGGQTFAGDAVDLILGTRDVEWVYGEGDNDLIARQGGNDWLCGGSGNYIIVDGVIIDESIFNRQISIATFIQLESI